MPNDHHPACRTSATATAVPRATTRVTDPPAYPEYALYPSATPQGAPEFTAAAYVSDAVGMASAKKAMVGSH